ncbi:MAG TPA: hypothetical protein VHN15_10410 [Thermoanaerobaculia bacterium]|nr:hypothetical protein [Thermoanaerobaculia bacterium]
MKNNWSFLSRTALAGFLACLLLAQGPDAFARQGRGGDDDGGDGAMTLRVNDAIGKPGGIVAVVLRTYAPRPIRQGQVRLRVVRKPARTTGRSIALPAVSEPVRPLLTLVSAVVYSQRGDSTQTAQLTGTATDQAVTVNFQSPSATINATDGPLAVFRFRLDPSVVPGQQFDIQVDPAVTSLFEAGGQAVVLDPRPAVLTIRNPRAPYAIEAEGDEVEPGEVAELGVQTFEPFQVAGGQMVMRWNPAVAPGTPTVTMDPRFGKSTSTVTRRRGLLIVRFQSPDASLNTVPGTFISVALPTAPGAAIGTTSPFTIDTTRSFLLNRRGVRIPLRYEQGSISFDD